MVALPKVNSTGGTISRSMSPRFRKSLLFITVFTSVYLIFSVDYSPNVIFKIIEERTQSSYNSHENYTIRTQGCHIPAMQPMNEVVKKYVHYPSEVKPCPNANYSLLEQNGTHIWIVKDTQILHHYKIRRKQKINCCYSSFYRPNIIQDISDMKLDERIQYNKCIYFKDTIVVDDEYVRVQCYVKNILVYDKFFVFATFRDRMSIDTDKEAKNEDIEKASYNVLVVGIDNLSRLNFHRTMPKTSEFMINRGAIELLGYNKVGDNSFPNLVPLLMGYAKEEIKEICHPETQTTFDDCPFLWHWYREAGYYTAFGEDSGYLGTFNYFMKGFRKSPTDYYLHPFIAEAERNAGKHHDFNVYLCLNEHYLYQVLLDYIKSITVTLWDLKLFGFFWETTMSHDDLNYPMVMDGSYVNFFKDLEYTGYLNKSIIFLISDHGMRWGSFRKTKQGYLEERLPLAYVLLPLSFRENYSEAFKNLKYNSQQLTTPYDVHKTLRDLIDLDNLQDEKILERTLKVDTKDRGISMFLKIPENRTCQAAGIADQWCTCHRREEISNTSKAIVSASEHLIYHLNSFLSGYVQCAELELEEILQSVHVVTDVIPDVREDWDEYSVVVKVKPSGGMFEATLRDHGKHWSVVGSVSRLNMYGNQSYCVHDTLLKMFCYCLNE